MFGRPTLVSLLALATANVVLSSPCVTFDADFNLLVFGLDGKDWNAGAQASWSSGSATDITTTGRPPFDGTSTTCYLSQFVNAVYIMNGDAANPSAVHIYDAGAKSWTTQPVTAGSFDPSSFDAILDHDTNVFYALSKGELFFLDMGQLKAANTSGLSWTDVEKAPYPDGYQPVMALAQNHIHFLDVPGVAAGSAEIFVIHFSFFQPTAQAYPLSDGSAFPATHGQATSFFQPLPGVQQEFAFIPDDGSATYVINVETNTTQSLPGPTTKDSKAMYAASITSLVQLDSTGDLTFLPYKQGDSATNAKAAWSKVANVAASAPAGASGANSSSAASGSAGPSHTGSSGAGASKTATGTAGAHPTGSAQSNNSPSSGRVEFGLVMAGVLSALACML